MVTTIDQMDSAAPFRLEFVLPPELEAHEPPEARGLARDEVRLLVTAEGGEVVAHDRFLNLAAHLRPGDLLVVNDSGTLAAALTARRRDGSEIALHLSTPLEGDLWVVEPRKTQVAEGESLALPGGGVATLLLPHADSRRLWVARLALPAPVLDYLAAWGRPISYAHLQGSWPVAMYQTVFAREAGSAEMPSAGRPFSERVLARLAERGVGVATLTLHTGVSSLEDDELPYVERYAVPAATAVAVERTRAAGGRVIAIGTTVVRALETAAGTNGKVSAGRGRTNLVVNAERGVRVVDGLLTGFHEPKSTHLWMLEAIAGRRHLERSYAAALAGGYLWHEFGDVHLILP